MQISPPPLQLYQHCCRIDHIDLIDWLTTSTVPTGRASFLHDAWSAQRQILKLLRYVHERRGNPQWSSEDSRPRASNGKVPRFVVILSNCNNGYPSREDSASICIWMIRSLLSAQELGVWLRYWSWVGMLLLKGCFFFGGGDLVRVLEQFNMYYVMYYMYYM